MSIELGWCARDLRTFEYARKVKYWHHCPGCSGPFGGAIEKVRSELFLDTRCRSALGETHDAFIIEGRPDRTPEPPTPEPDDWLDGEPLSEWIAADSFDHESEHAQDISTWEDRTRKSS